MTSLDVQVLGPLRVLRDGVEVDVGRPKQRLLLAVLATAGGETVSVDRLVDELWGDDAPPRPAASVQAYVSKLRQVLEPGRARGADPQVLVTRAPGYALRLQPGQLDVTRFAAGAEEARRLLRDGRFERADEVALDALQLWRGDLLADFPDDPVTVRERPRWQELRLALEEDRQHAALELGRYAPAIAELERLLTTHPLRERALGLLLRALYRAGRHAEALARYRSYRVHLQDELGLDPGPELQALEAAILRQDPALLGVVDAPTPDRGGHATEHDAAEDRRDRGPGLSAPPREEPLVGRDLEVVDVEQQLADIGAGRARWLVVSGEAGIGKTSLAEAATRRAADRGIEVSWGRCDEGDDAPAYWPFTQLLRELAPSGADPIDELLHGAGAPLDPGARRYRLHTEVQRLLLAGGPRLLVVDDVQWADVASLQLLGFLARHLDRAAIGVLLTVRTGVDRPDLRQLLATIARRPGALRRELEPLSAAELSELAERLTGTPLASDEAARLHDRTSGNPFFASELLRLPHGGGRTDHGRLPPAVHDVIERRLAPLGDDVRAALHLAAVVGTAFDVPLLEEASGMEPDHLFDALDLAVASGVVVAADDASFRFRHALVRDAVLAGLTALRRQRLHAQVGEALRRRPRRDPARQASELAHHLAAASTIVGVDAAYEAVESAARSAAARLAFEEAAAWWRTGADLLDRHDGDPLLTDHALVEAGRALLLAGRTEDGRDLLCTAIDRALGRSDPTTAADAVIAIGEAGGAWYWVGPGESPADVVGRIEAVLAALGPADGVPRVRVLGVLAPGIYYEDPARAGDLGRTALALARRLDEPEVLGAALLDAMACEWGPTTGERHLQLSDELLALPAVARGPVTEVAARLWRATAYLERGELERADRELDTVERVADASRMEVLRAQAAIARIGWTWLVGRDLDAVEAAIDRAARAHERSGLYRLDGVRMANRAVVRLLQGRLDEVAADLPVLFDVGLGRSTFEAFVHLGRGDLDRAREALGDERGLPLRGSWQWLPAIVLRAMAAVEADAVSVARRLHDELAPHTDRVLVTGTSMTSLGPIGLHAGALAVLDGDLTTAERHLRAAHERCVALGTPIWGALAACRLGEVLLRRGEVEEGRQLLERAVVDAERAGLEAAAEAAQRTLTGGR
jgi:DNA-binding SARP family transcriptional activator